MPTSPKFRISQKRSCPKFSFLLDRHFSVKIQKPVWLKTLFTGGGREKMAKIFGKKKRNLHNFVGCKTVGVYQRDTQPREREEGLERGKRVLSD